MLKKMLLLTASAVSMYASTHHSTVGSGIRFTTGMEETARAASATGRLGLGSAIPAAAATSAATAAQFDAFKAQIVDTVTHLEAERASLVQQLDGLRRDSDIIRRELEKANAMIAEHENAAHASESRNAEMVEAAKREAAGIWQPQLDEKTTALSALGVQLEEVTQHRDTLLARLAEGDSAVGALQEELRANRETAAALRECLTVSDARKQELSEDNSAKAREIAELQRQVGEKQDAVAAMGASLAEKNQDLDAAKAELQRLRESSVSGEQLALREAEIKRMESDLAALRTDMEQKDLVLAGLRADRDSKVSELTAKNEALTQRMQPFSRFMEKYDAAGSLRRSPSGIFDDAMALSTVHAQLQSAQERLDSQGRDFAGIESGMRATIEDLQRQLAGNGAALADLEQLRSAAAAAATSHQADLDAMREDYERRIAGMVSADDLDAASARAASLEDQLRAETEAKSRLQAQVDTFDAQLAQMATAAAGNEALVGQLRQQTDRLTAAKAEAERAAQTAAQALRDADAKRATEMQARRDARAAAAASGGFVARSNAEYNAELAAARSAAEQMAAAVASKKFKDVEIKRMLDVAAAAGIVVSDENKRLLEARNTRNDYSRDSAGDEQRKADDNAVSVAKQEPARTLLGLLREKAAALGVSTPDQLDTTGLTGAILAALARKK